MQYFIHTFGCQMNENDSSLIGALLKNAGHTLASDINDADIIIVNTCCVRENAENRALGFLGSLKHLKMAKPELIIAVCGCMTQRAEMAQKLHISYRHIGIIIGTFAASRLPQYISEYKANGLPIIDIEERYDGQELTHTNKEAIGQGSWRAQINISFGCNNFCSYCIVPYVRGRERSRSAQDIINEAKCLLAGGVKEIQLLGQNVNSYGNDFNDHKNNFALLLGQLNQLDGLYRLRFMTSHPRDFNEKLIYQIAAMDKVCHHFHLPLQSGCDKLLSLMNRGYTTENYYRLIEAIRNAMPDATITTDLIIGFPGETEQDFQETINFIKKCQFNSAYTFIYSKRSGTKAAEMPNHIDNEVKKSRIQYLQKIQNAISLSHNQALIGKTLPIMAEGNSKNNPSMQSGRTDGNKIVVFECNDVIIPGEIINIKITEAKTWNLIGEVSKPRL